MRCGLKESVKLLTAMLFLSQPDLSGQCLSSDIIAFLSQSIDGAIVQADTFPSCFRRLTGVNSEQTGHDTTSLGGFVKAGKHGGD